MRWLDRWGYDPKDLFPQESRCTMLTLHSMKEIALQVEEVVPGSANDIDSLVNSLLVKRDGKVLQESKNKFKLHQHF